MSSERWKPRRELVEVAEPGGHAGDRPPAARPGCSMMPHGRPGRDWPSEGNPVLIRCSATSRIDRLGLVEELVGVLLLFVARADDLGRGEDRAAGGGTFP